MGNVQKVFRKDEGYSELHDAAERGDTEAVRRLLMLSANVNKLDTEHNTPLHYASQNGHVDVVNLLLSKNPSVDTRGDFGQTSLHPTVKYGRAGVVKKLKYSDANVNSCNKGKMTALHIACQNSHTSIVEILLDSHATVDFETLSQETSLHIAAKGGHADIVQKLIIYGADVNACNNTKMTALHLACQHGHISIVEILLNNNATVDVMTQSEETPFYLAAKNGHADVTDLLLSRGVCDFVLRGDYNETPLHVAVGRGYPDVVEVILEHSRKMSNKLANHRQKTPETIDSLIENSGILPIQLLRCDGRQISAGIVWSEENKSLEIWEDKHGSTALANAVTSAQPKMFKLLLNEDQGMYSERHLALVFLSLRSPQFSNVVTDCRTNNETATALSDAEKYQLFSENIKEIAQDLISSSKFNVNHMNELGETLIHDMINGIGCVDIVPGEKIHTIYVIQLLLEKGADFNVLNAEGETPLMIASKRGCCDVIQILFDWEQKSGMKLDLDARDQYGETAMMKAISSYDVCHALKIQFDWEQTSLKKQDIDARDRDGATTLAKAVERNHVSVIRLLLDHKASVNLCDYYGFTALHAAVYEPDANWFDLHFFCKDLHKRHCDGVNSLANSSGEQLQLGGEIMDRHRIIYWLQCHIQFLQRAVLSRKDVLKRIGRERSHPSRPYTVFHRQLSNLRRRLEAVKLLLDDEEINVNAKDFIGYTPLDLAMVSDKEINPKSLKAPKNRGATRKFHEAPLEVSKAGLDDRGRNPLHRLIISRILDSLFQYDVETLQERNEEQFDFIRNGILLSPKKFRKNFRESATAKDMKGRIPLHYAAMLPSKYDVHNNRDRVKLLLKMGSEVNSVDIYGKTPLHYAEEEEQYKLLIKLGAAENTKDNFGYSPRDLMELRDLVTINKNNAERSTDMQLYSSIDISQVLNTYHVTELTNYRLVETVRIYSQSPRPQESSEEAVWRIWTENAFPCLNRRLSQLKPPVKHFIERLADGIKAKDWRFECLPILVGSAEEETKVIISADFDFNFRLIKFSKMCDPFPHPLGLRGYFGLKRKTYEDTESRSDQMFDSFFDLDHCLLTDEVNCRFKVILEEVLSDTDLWQGEHLFDWNMKHKYSSRYGYLRGLCTAILLKMIHPIEDGEGGFLFVNISVDIAACVHVEDWWPEDALPIIVKPYGCTFVFDRPDKLSMLRGSLFFPKTFVRISFAPLESRVIKQSSLLVKAAYKVCKMIFYSKPKSTYQLKTCLLFCMEALNARNGDETTVEDSITPKQLAFWVERIMFCFMEFSRHHVFPCYFMPSFRVRQPYKGRGQIFFKSKIDEHIKMDLIPFSYCKAFDLYLDLCPDDTAIDIPVVHSIHRKTPINDDPLWERFDREEFTRMLSSRRFH